MTIEGRTRVRVTPDDDRFSSARVARTIACASGERRTDAWTGVPIDALAAAADLPGETTHLRIAADDFAADVPIRAALDGLVAFDREGSRGAERGLPRFVAPNVAGERLVKRVRRLAGVALAPDEDPKLG
ncbi:hypothetical protein BRC82_08400 [Halobacteriales archaeon QS_1_67_19]|nr:MAG: hypothetical protein BRC82_08400 [Halobacteriales archaeon QS_1_67_19]